MHDLVPLDPLLLKRMGITKSFFEKRFEPSCRYLKTLDWFIYITKDCSYVSTHTASPFIAKLMHGGEIVGFKIMAFSRLPREVRGWFTEIVNIDLDDIRGIEELWILNFEEMLPQFEKDMTAFFGELRRRDNFYRFEALHYPASWVDIRKRHSRLMVHLFALDPARLP